MLYESAGYDAAIWPESYWRASGPMQQAHAGLHGAICVDVAVIGAGYAGLNAALELVERFGLRVAVLDAAQPGWGASGRNGGFCCLGGSMLDARAIMRRAGQDAAREWQAFEHAAIARVRDNLQRYDIDAQTTETGEVLLAHSPRAWAGMQAEALTDGGAALWDRQDLQAQGLATAAYYGGRYSPHGFGLHPFAYVTGLARAAAGAGVRIFGDSRVTGLQPDGAGWVLRTAQGQVRATQVVIATNGYTDERLPRWIVRRTLPVLSNIMVTRPLSSAELAAQGWTRHLMAYDARMMLHYFRLLPDGRFLFGARDGTSFAPDAVARFTTRARTEYEVIFPHLAQAETEYSWNGLVCLTGSRAPYIGPVPGAGGLWLALGWHGNGVAAASEGGRRVARAVMGDASAPPALLRRPPPRFMFPRKLGLRMAMAAAAVLDGPVRPVR
ncbi:NAD(P)/FAD-dependent oxidoreductase [Roseinatronobacter alkalisoli]|uniref:FAD-binding oxidoreductase n=1 Tax=Roseinatronobacter alkalisoli TaxID=3028235 RepID=A0ABT5T3Q2_9RHOB|nr:FAD-binding oxidoreductase [Roseinatronobacter sp. HJB301]MDD7969606.1 FAD-binding oxidoreductase [Roseinatronobacter sp. HJB301]